MLPLRSRSRIPALAVAGAVLLAPFATSSSAHADPIDDQRARVEYYADLLEDLEEQAMILGEEYDVALLELEQLNAEVTEAEQAVAAKQAEVAELQGQLSEAAVQAFMGASSTGVGVFADPAQFNEELQRSELTRVAMNTGTADADDLEEAVNDLTEEQAGLEDKRDEAEAKKEQVADARTATEARVAEYQQAREDAEAELGQLIREEQERRAREAHERMLAEARAAEERAEAQAAAAREAQQQANTAQPTTNSPSGGANTSSGGANTSSGGANTSSGGGNTSSAGGKAPSGGGGNVPAASSRAGTAVSAALSQQGVPYKYAAASPGVAFDCSGLTSWAWGQAGVYLPHQSAQQAAMLPSVPPSSAQPGDLIFYYSPVSHVALYVGNGMLVHAPNTGSEVHTRAVNWDRVVKVGRPG